VVPAVVIVVGLLVCDFVQTRRYPETGGRR
jgi:hypothetical protein